MPRFSELVTDLKNSDLPNLRLKLYCFPADNPNNGRYLREFEVNIDGHHREVSSKKFFDLGYYYMMSDLLIELRVFTTRGFSGVALSPLQIRDHVRIVFWKHPDYDSTGKVLIEGIRREGLRVCLSGRRGFGRILGRKALYDTLKAWSIVGYLPKGPSSSHTLIGSEQQSEEQNPLSEDPSSSNLAGSGQPIQIAKPKWLQLPIRLLKTKSCRVYNRGNDVDLAF